MKAIIRTPDKINFSCSIGIFHVRQYIDALGMWTVPTINHETYGFYGREKLQEIKAASEIAESVFCILESRKNYPLNDCTNNELFTQMITEYFLVKGVEFND
jgi:hypothetical protein